MRENSTEILLARALEQELCFGEAEAVFARLGCWGDVARTKRRGLHWHNLAEADVRTEALIDCAQSGDMEPLSLFNVDCISPEKKKQAACNYVCHHWGKVLEASQKKPFFATAHARGYVRGSTSGQARLRIGYLSGNFFGHALRHLLADVLSAHDKVHFDFRLYAYGAESQKEYEAHLQQTGIPLRDLERLSDERAAHVIAKDALDLLIDLKGLGDGARPQILAYRPAPQIVSWLGFPGSVGHAGLADYLIGDPIVTPLEHASHFSETLALMPHVYQPDDRRCIIGRKPQRTALGLPEDGIVFCSFNKVSKFSPSFMDVWCRLLEAAPGSVLWLLECGQSRIQANLCNEVQKRGIAPERVVFAPWVSLEEHLARLQLADIALDTYPYNSHTTASDALWAGVPLVTRMGPHYASRVGASLLISMGLEDLIAENDAGYYLRALRLVTNPARWQQARERLQRSRQTSPLFDTERFTRDLERLYRAIWAQREVPRNKRQAIALAE